MKPASLINLSSNRKTLGPFWPNFRIRLGHRHQWTLQRNKLKTSLGLTSYQVPNTGGTLHQHLICLNFAWTLAGSQSEGPSSATLKVSTMGLSSAIRNRISLIRQPSLNARNCRILDRWQNWTPPNTVTVCLTKMKWWINLTLCRLLRQICTLVTSKA